MAKAVVQYLRGLDVSGLRFGPDPSSGVTTERQARHHSGSAEGAPSIWLSTDVIASMCRLQWLKMRDDGLTENHIPRELSKLPRLESLSLSRNQLTRLSSIKNWPSVLPALRSLNCRKNNLTDRDAIPSDIFECPNLQVLDFSCNHLSIVPPGIEKTKGLLVLNLSQNQITVIPPDLFVQCTDLMLLDLSDNQLESLPAQLRRCSSLQQLILSRNPLRSAHLRSLAALKQLEVLHLASTERKVENIPSEMDKLERLAELDLCDNLLTRIPEPVLSLRALRKLNLAHNEINDVCQITDNWPKLEYLNLSYNRLAQLPSGITRLTSLRKLYVNNNVLTFTGIPAGIGKLKSLEIFDASYNKLENIPESLCRCGRLKRLHLNSNQLLTLPDAIHYLRETLEVFEVDNNPQLRFPPKPPELQKGAGLAYYNIDFSLDAQLRQICGKPPESAETTYHAKDTATRLRRLRRRRGEEVGDGSKCVLEGMQRIAREKEALLKKREQEAEEETKMITAKRWQDQLNRPHLDYSTIFDEETGTVEGIEMWELDEFYPKRVDDEVAQGRVFDGDCYIILHTKMENDQLDWVIYYWIGSKTTMDKQSCAAIHAVNLRNFLGAQGRTFREEQGEESEDFLALFGKKFMVLEGSHGETGFYHVEEEPVMVKLYRLFGNEKRLLIVSMPLSPMSLDPKYCYLVDGQSQLYLWLGAQSRLMVRTKGRLLAERICVRERRGGATIRLEPQGRESNAFWAVMLGKWTPPPLCTVVSTTEPQDSDNKAKQEEAKKAQAKASETVPDYPPPPEVTPPSGVPKDFIPVDWKPPQPILYDVRMGKGFLELPQVEIPFHNLTKKLLDPKHVYLLDSGGELFVWMGEKSTRFLRFAGCKLAQELSDLMPRGSFGGAEAQLASIMSSNDQAAIDAWTSFTRPPPQICCHGAECQIFRVQFSDWEEAMAVDYTRTMESVSRRGADLQVILERDKMKADLRALLAPRERPLGWDEALNLMNDWNDELVEPIGPDLIQNSALQQFIMIDGKWIPVEPEWFGQFFNQDSYIVIARYWDFDDEPPPDDQEGGKDSEQEEPPNEERTKTVVYFWQGREATDVQWLTFNFSVRNDMEVRLSQNPNEDGAPLKVEFKRVRQQQEDLVFLAHFQRQIIIHRGHYCDRLKADRMGVTQMYYVRANGNAISTRSIEVVPSAIQLNSCFTYIVKAPWDSGDSSKSPHVWIWLGKKARPDDKALTESIAHRIFDPMKGELEIIYEGTEPELFWKCIGGKKKYDESADYLEFGRLFRLSNDQGFFCASEKCSDFCQDDLADDDVMMLDTGDQIYLWWGRRTSDVEQKLSLQAAKLYQKHLCNVQRDRPRALKLTCKAVEPHMFKRCFHGWGPFREPKDWSG
ncbi:unnamed protein product [Calicophoron daubneyi]|uniref:Gelsolin-like domain-containing protein n=1 Tax=Calicophoron daubneyi TaxID=300641 RepID=A0AAV2TCR3_CALDB